MAPASTLDELKIIANWSEEPFDTDYYKDHEFVAGDTAELSKHGVHAEYLPTLQALKKEIAPYLEWAQPKVDAGAAEVTLFSTLNLHIFQTYYGGLRPTADMSEWMYGDFDLVSQFITDGQDLKPWLEEQGGKFVENQQTLIGALWYRENEFAGAESTAQNIRADGAHTSWLRRTLCSPHPPQQLPIRSFSEQLRKTSLLKTARSQASPAQCSTALLSQLTQTRALS